MSLFWSCVLHHGCAKVHCLLYLIIVIAKRVVVLLHARSNVGGRPIVIVNARQKHIQFFVFVLISGLKTVLVKIHVIHLRGEILHGVLLGWNGATISLKVVFLLSLLLGRLIVIVFKLKEVKVV